MSKKSKLKPATTRDIQILCLEILLVSLSIVGVLISLVMIDVIYDSHHGKIKPIPQTTSKHYVIFSSVIIPLGLLILFYTRYKGKNFKQIYFNPKISRTITFSLIAIIALVIALLPKVIKSLK